MHFGALTHWRLRLVARGPLWALDRAREPAAAGALDAEDASWSLVVWPQPDKREGTPTPFSTHIDGGRSGILEKQGAPPPPPPPPATEGGAAAAEPVTRADARMLAMLAEQVALGFYCVTPTAGEGVGPLQGATGMFPLAHLALLEVRRAREARARRATPRRARYRAISRARPLSARRAARAAVPRPRRAR